MQKLDPLSVPVACQNGKWVNGKSCSLATLALQESFFPIPDGLDTAKTIATQLANLAQACNSNQSSTN